MGALVFRRRTPLIVGWNITYRCNLRCKYCGVCDIQSEELDTDKCFRIIDEMKSLGTRFISFSGGEPLLREDLGRLIDRCGQRDMRVSVNSNGALAVERFELIRKAGEIQFSFDGPKHINDALRGPGVHDGVIEAVARCRRDGLTVNLGVVISQLNLKHLDYVLDVAKEFQAGVNFQPMDRSLSTNCRQDIDSAFSPDSNEYREAIEDLIRKKSAGNSRINASIDGLRHLQRWPDDEKLFCLASLLHCNVLPDGKIFFCDMFPHFQQYAEPAESGFAEAFKRLRPPGPCERCWSSGMVELNLLGSLKFSALIGMYNRFRKGFGAS